MTRRSRNTLCAGPDAARVRPTLLLGAALALTGLAALPTFAYVPGPSIPAAVPRPSTTLTFDNPRGTANFFVVPTNVFSLNVTLRGAGGGCSGSSGGAGASVSGNLTVAPGERLTVSLAAAAGASSAAASAVSAAAAEAAWSAWAAAGAPRSA